MTSEQVRQLHADGFTIGSHTSDHPPLGKLDDWNEVRRQVQESCDFVREITRRPRVPFAFPFNGVDLARDTLADLREEVGIDLMYDTNNFMADRSFIVNRVWCDSPKWATEKRSNLPLLIWWARTLEPLRVINRSLGRFHV